MSLKKCKEIINKNILNENVKREINDIIDYFIKNGKIIIEGNNLCGKLKKGKDFLELKYDNDNFLCNYSIWNFCKFVTISAIKLNDNNIKIERKEKVEYESNDEINRFNIEEYEEIYSNKNKLLYKSVLKANDRYLIKNNNLQYLNDHYFFNYFDLNKNWYINNGSIINYKLFKSFMDSEGKLKESYSICPEIYHDEFGNHACFVKLDEELFKLFMSGNITIEEVLEKIDSEEYYKILTKSITPFDIK